MGTFDLEPAKITLGSFSALFLILSHNSKTAHSRMKRLKILALGVNVVCISVVVTLNLARSFGVIRCTFPKLRHNSKPAHCRMKQTKIWTSGMYLLCIWVPLTLNLASSFGVIRCTLL